MEKTDKNRLVMTFGEATRFVDKHRLVAFSYIPPADGEKTTLGRLYIMTYMEDPFATDTQDESGIFIICLKGRFYSDSEKDDYFNLDDVPVEAKAYKYEVTQLSTINYSNYFGSDILVHLKLLSGSSEQEAFNVDSCQRCDWMLFKTGIPENCFKCSNIKNKRSSG